MTVSETNLVEEHPLMPAAIGARESGMQCAQVIAEFGGGILVSTLSPPEDIPASVQGKSGKS